MRKVLLASLVVAFSLLQRGPAEAVPNVNSSESDESAARAIGQLFPGTVKVGAAKVNVTSVAGIQKVKSADAKNLISQQFATAGWFFDNLGNCLWVPDQTKYVSFSGTYNANTKGVIVANLTTNTQTVGFAARGQMSATLKPQKGNKQYTAKIDFAIAVTTSTENVTQQAKLTQILSIP